MDDYTKIKTKIDSLKAEVEQSAITPPRLGSLLLEILDFATDIEQKLSETLKLQMKTFEESFRKDLTLLTPQFLASEDEYERKKENGELVPGQWYAVAEED